MKKVSGIITNLTHGKKDNKSVMLTIKDTKVPITIETAKFLLGDDADPMEVVQLVQDSMTPSFSKVWVSSKLIAHNVHGKSDAPVVIADIKDKEFFCAYHQQGDVLNDESIVTDSDVLVNNDTVVIS